MAQKTVAFPPERQKQVRQVAVATKEMLFDLETGKIFLAGRGQLDIHESVMSMTMQDAVLLCTQFLQISGGALIQALQNSVVAAENDKH